jgi:hypothetical protein
MRTTKYTKEQVKKLYDERTELVGYTENYARQPDMFIVLPSDKSIAHISHCKESTCAYVQHDMRLKPGLSKIAITREAGPGGIFDAVRTSNQLHDVEEELGLYYHSMKCLSIKGTSSRIAWVFTLDNKWYNAPPTMSFVLDVIRNGFRNMAIQRDHMVYRLLSTGTPQEVFGRRRKRNWGIAGRSVKTLGRVEEIPYEGRFDSRYGMVYLDRDVKSNNRDKLKAKFPEHKIFKKLQEKKKHETATATVVTPNTTVGV